MLSKQSIRLTSPVEAIFSTALSSILIPLKCLVFENMATPSQTAHLPSESARSCRQVRVGEYDLRVLDRSERSFGIREKLDVPEYGANGTRVGDLAVLLLDLSTRPAISFSAEVRRRLQSSGTASSFKLQMFILHQIGSECPRSGFPYA